MYTESEAEEKWCPQMRKLHPDEPVSLSCLAGGACIASRCMAWRPSFPKMVDGQMVPTGYCGLAGEPKR